MKQTQWVFIYVNVVTSDNKYIHLHTKCRQEKPTSSTRTCITTYMYIFYQKKNQMYSNHMQGIYEKGIKADIIASPY